MKFYETNEPYYALLKAKDFEDAVEKYVENVSDVDPEDSIEDSLKEVNRDYALVTYSRANGNEETSISTNKILELFNRDVADILLIDSTLI